VVPGAAAAAALAGDVARSGAAEAGSSGAPDTCALCVAPLTSAETLEAVVPAGAAADEPLTEGVVTDGTVATGVDTRGVVTEGTLTGGTGATVTAGVVAGGVVTEGVVPTGVLTEGTAAIPASGDATSTPSAAAAIPTPTACLVPMAAVTAASHQTCVFLQIPPERAGHGVPARAQRPQTSSATPTISSSLARSSSIESLLPSSVEEKPHCGERQSWSRST
jgi:hypothetical protein